MQSLASIQYEEPLYCDPSFPVSFHADAMDEARRSVYANWHTGIELLLCYAGSACLVSGTRISRFSAGDLVVIESNALHAIYAESPECVYDCLAVEPSFLLSCGVPLGEVRFSSVVRDARASAIFGEIAQEFRGERDWLYKAAVLGSLLRLFAILCRDHATKAAAGGDEAALRQQAAMQRALEYVRAHLSEPIRLDELCRHVGVSKYYFCRLFHTFTELSPMKFINMLRCDYARRLMTEGRQNVAEAARAVGVENLSYFTRMYKKYMGRLPSEDAAGREKRDRKGEVIGILGTQRDAHFLRERLEKQEKQ